MSLFYLLCLSPSHPASSFRGKKWGCVPGVSTGYCLEVFENLKASKKIPLCRSWFVLLVVSCFLDVFLLVLCLLFGFCLYCLFPCCASLQH